MGEVIIAPIITRLDVPVERILDSAASACLTEVVVIGFTEDGEEYFASSAADGGSVLWHLERAKMKLLGVPENLTEPGEVD